MRVLVTGASGFLGSHTVALLLRQGHQVACLLREGATLIGELYGLPWGTPGADGSGVLKLCQEFSPDVVVHLAAYYVAEHRPQDLEPLISSNILLGNQVLEAMRLCGVRSMVYAGTSWQHYEGEEYRPVNLYAATKQAFCTVADYYRDVAGLRVLELHLYDSYGETDRRPRLLNLLQRSAHGDEVALSPGEQRMHLVHVEDLAEGVAMAARQVQDLPAGARAVYRLPSVRALSLKELVAAFNAADPAFPARVRLGARPYRDREVFHPWEGAEVLPGWSPAISLEEGLRRFRAARG